MKYVVDEEDDRVYGQDHREADPVEMLAIIDRQAKQIGWLLEAAKPFADINSTFSYHSKTLGADQFMDIADVYTLRATVARIGASQ